MVRGFASAVVAAQQQIAADPERGVDAAIAEVPAIADDRETALAVLEATIEAWDRAGHRRDRAWMSGRRATRPCSAWAFIDGSVPVEEMYDDTVMDEAGSG